MYAQRFKSLNDIPADAMAELEKLDPNIPGLIGVIEELPHEGRQYFYFRNLMGNYIKALSENKGLNDDLAEARRDVARLMRQQATDDRAD